MKIHVNLKNTGISLSEVESQRADAEARLDMLWSGEMAYTSWLDYPNIVEAQEVDQIIETGEKIRKDSDVLLVLGAGGSFMGAKAVIDLLGDPLDKVSVIFAGYNFSERYLRDVFYQLEGKDVSLCVISKSGSTMETLTAYSIFQEWMHAKYGDAAKGRTYIITESVHNKLGEKATQDELDLFLLNPDIGGRYSVLTAVGLLPIAVAGIDVHQLLQGAKDIACREAFRKGGLDYAILRQILYHRGKRIEVFESFDPYFAYFGEWLRQLFGESEGKDGKGIFPSKMIFSRDLHSMGQFLQQGTPCFFETMVHVREAGMDCPDYTIPGTLLESVAGKTLRQLNRCAEEGVFDAHVKAGNPVIQISIERLDAYNVGQLLYFFEVQCAVSALLAGVCPFDQPGVEAYKTETRIHIQNL